MWNVARRRRADRRVRFTLRLDDQLDKQVRILAFNHKTSKQVVMHTALALVLEDDWLKEELVRKMPNPQMYPYVVISD